LALARSLAKKAGKVEGTLTLSVSVTGETEAQRVTTAVAKLCNCSPFCSEDEDLETRVVLDLNAETSQRGQVIIDVDNMEM
jgi:hypothetical protein